MPRCSIAAAGLAGAVLVASATASANPRPLPFTYTTDTLAEGNVEIEQYADLVPLRAISPATSGRETFLASAFQTEFEVGLRDRLELGLYITLVPNFGDALANQTAPAGTGTGLKQRLRYILAEPTAWPIDVGLYGEVVETEREIEVEGKLLLQRTFDRLRLAANVSAEYEWYFSKQREVVLNPSAGATYEITPGLHVGVESWMHGEYPQHPKPATRTFGLGPHVYLGPTALFALGKLWWSIGAYGRLTDRSHDLQPGEPYGRVWVRSIIGYDL